MRELKKRQQKQLERERKLREKQLEKERAEREAAAKLKAEHDAYELKVRMARALGRMWRQLGRLGKAESLVGQTLDPGCMMATRAVGVSRCA